FRSIPHCQLERVAILDPDNILVPDRAGEGAAVADGEAVVVSVVDAQSELGVDDRVAGGVLYQILSSVELLPTQDGPADELDDGGDGQALHVLARNLWLAHDEVAEADAVRDHVAGEVGAG